jgi:hypothetical protein
VTDFGLGIESGLLLIQVSFESQWYQFRNTEVDGLNGADLEILADLLELLDKWISYGDVR